MHILLITSVVTFVVALFVSRLFGSNNMPWKARLIWFVSLSLGTLLIGPGSFAIAAQIAYSSAIEGFHQFLNGTVVVADKQELTCSRDGFSCRYTYLCDPYSVTHYTYDSKGNVNGSYTTTEYHSCPYTVHEYNFSTTDSIGGTVYYGGTVGENPVPWREGVGIPPDLPTQNPVDWQRARTALDNGRGLPMTVDNQYVNYFLASDSSLLRASSDDISLLKKDKLLPKHTANVKNPIHDTFDANKVAFVGFKPEDAPAWQSEVMQFNAALGSELRGDLHLVIVRASALPSSVSSEDYLNAIKAYWQNNLGKFAFGKNGIVVVIGVDDAGKNIEWARASTGMPVGNGTMTEYLQNRLHGTPFNLEDVMGSTFAEVANGEAHYVYGQGIIPQAIMVETPFERACMQCTDEGENQSDGFADIAINAPVEPWGYVLTILLTLVIAGCGWGYFYSKCMEATEEIGWKKRRSEYDLLLEEERDSLYGKPFKNRKHRDRSRFLNPNKNWSN